jgi:hypothetical protein
MPTSCSRPSRPTAARSWSAAGDAARRRDATEHGFASLFPQARGRRRGLARRAQHRPAADHGDGHHCTTGGHGAMTLRAGGLDWSGAAARVRARRATCDCCGTAAAASTHGVTVVYRDRSDTRSAISAPSPSDRTAGRRPRPVGDEGWEMPACPVNGPALALMASGSRPRGSRPPRAGPACSRPSPPTAGAAGARRSRSRRRRRAGARGDRDARRGSAVVSWLENSRCAGPRSASGACPWRAARPRPYPGHHLAARSSGFPQMALAGTGCCSPGPASASRRTSPPRRSPALSRPRAQVIRRSAAMRSSSGGWVMNSRLKPRPGDRRCRRRPAGPAAWRCGPA